MFKKEKKEGYNNNNNNTKSFQYVDTFTVCPWSPKAALRRDKQALLFLSLMVLMKIDELFSLQGLQRVHAMEREREGALKEWKGGLQVCLSVYLPLPFFLNDPFQADICSTLRH